MNTTCPKPSELERYAMEAAEFKGRGWSHWSQVPIIAWPAYFKHRRIETHLAACEECRQSVEDSDAAIVSLHMGWEVDPGDAFTQQVLARMKDYHPPITWDVYVHRLFPVAAAAIALLLFLICLWPTGVGRDQVTVTVPPKLIANGPFTLPVYVTDKQGQPVKDSRVTIRLNNNTLHGKTNANGLYLAKLTVPETGESYYDRSGQVEVEVITRSGKHEVTVPLQAETRESLYLSTDKPIYQPGQTVHMRILCLHRTTLTPITTREVTFTVRDAKDSLLFEKTVKTSEWGIASCEMLLEGDSELGDYTVEAKTGTESQSRTITVSRYTLPKFKATLTTARKWYLPGQVISGQIDARYFFGKPCAGARVRIEAVSATGIDESPFAQAAGNANADGRFNFRLQLPDKLIGVPQHGGNAAVSLKATVADAAGHVKEITRAFPVARNAILISVLPESGAPVVGVENEFYVITSYPDGSPAPATVSMHSSMSSVQTTVTTNKQGIGVFKFTPDGEVRIDAVAFDSAGQTGSFYGTLTSIGERLGDDKNSGLYNYETGLPLYSAPTIMVRTDKPTYKVGETMKLAILAPGQSGTLYLEVTREMMPISSSIIPLRDGKAIVSLPVSHDMTGFIGIQAYLPDASMKNSETRRSRNRLLNDIHMMVAQGNRMILVQPSDDLKFALHGMKTSRPGEEQQVTLHVTDSNNNGIQAAVGLTGVDEAVYAIEDQHPGLARIFFLLQQELNSPIIDVHDDSLPDRYRLINNIPDDSTAARVALAAYSSQPILLMMQYGNDIALHLRKDIISERLSRYGLYVGIMFICIMMAWLLTRWHRYSYFEFASMGYRLFISFAIAYITYLFLIYSIHSLSMNGIVAVYLLIPWFVWILILRWIITIPSSDNFIRFVLIFVCIPVLASILFPVFSKAREKARSTTIVGMMRQAQTFSENMQKDKPSPATKLRVRDYFPETLLWLPEVVTDKNGMAKVTIPGADSITTWRLSLLANTRDGRIASADIPYRVYQDFFVEPDVPVQLTVGDACSLPVAVHNYLKERQTITLALRARGGLAVSGTAQTRITLDAGAVGKVLLPVKAVSAGDGEITITARGTTRNDAVRKTIPIIPAGRREEISRGGVLREAAAFAVDLPADADPATSTLSLRLYPGPVSQVLAGLEGMLQRPYGCFEQTTSTTYPNIMVLRYLRANKSNDVQTMAKAQTYVAQGYERLRGFEVDGGGFSLFGQAPAEFGLTALGLMEFQDMAEVQQVNDAMLRRTTAWLKAHWQNADPMARSFAALPLSRAGEGDFAADWVRERAVTAQALSSYELALLANTAVALKLDGKEALLKELASRSRTVKEGAYWPSRGSGDYGLHEYWMGSSEVEITGLAVQALTAAHRELSLVEDGCDFLTAQRAPDGGWPGTQATVQALRALLAVNTATSTGTVAIRVNGKAVVPATLTGDGVVKRIALSAHLRRGRNVVELSAKPGTAPACQLVLRYYDQHAWRTAVRAPRNPVAVSYDKSQLRAGDTVTAKVQVNLPRTAGMAMIDLAIPPGFLPLADDLERLKAQRRIERYDITGTQLILYLRELPAGTPLSFTYRLRALYPINATVRPSAVYPYYEPETRYESAPGRVIVL